MAFPQFSSNENSRWQEVAAAIKRVESSTSSMPIQLQQSCNASTSFQNQFQSTSSQNLADDQSTATSITLHNPFEYDQSNINMNINNSNFRSMRYPLSTYAPSYHTQNSYMTTNHIPQIAFQSMMNPMMPLNDATQSIGHTIQTTQQGIGHTISCIYPIQPTSSISTTFFNTNDQNHYTMGHENRK